MLTKTCKSIALALGLCVLAVSMPGLAADAPIRIRMATLAPRGTLYHQVLLEMGEKWRQAQGNGATFTVFPDGAQGGEGDIVRRMRVGQLNGAMISVVGLMQIDRSVSALQYLPLLMRNWEEVDAVGAVMRPEIERRLYDKGYVVLLWGEGGWVHFFSKERALTPADFR
jgi:TRAP-type C4-dicarboxylate transport system substrate-binding protein